MNHQIHNNDNKLGYIFALLKFLFLKLGGFISIFACVLILIIINNDSNFSKNLKAQSIDVVHNFYDTISSPFSTIPNIANDVKAYFDAINKNQGLKQENTELKKQLQELQLASGEAEKLRRLLNVKTNNHKKEITVRIISQAFNNYNKTFNINAGSLNGVKLGQAVVNDEGLIGKVIYVTENSAKVLAVTDMNAKVPSMLVKSRTKCIVTGSNFGNDNLKILYLPKNVAISNGEAVTTSGEGGVFPYGVAIGNIIEKDGEYLVKSIVDWKELEFAKVLISE